ncbi:MAG: hypothetical protein NZ534_13265, partial [Bacteroidia bacterium]|nr:hypothetical protein [Bacteroidia bacterium]
MKPSLRQLQAGDGHICNDWIGGRRQREDCQRRIRFERNFARNGKTRTTAYKSADSGYVSAWYLDEDYDGDCFVDCQMFFDFRKKPALSKLGV